MMIRRLLIPILALSLAACEGSGGSSGGEVLARAGGYDFEARSAAEILAPQSDLPNQPEIAEALADLWVQYYLLARATAADTTLHNLNVAPLVQRQVEGEMVAELRDRVIQVDTAISEENLRERFAAEAPGAQVRARHILLQFPDNATQAQVDSVRALADSLRSRLLGGEDFAELARQYSQDTGTAPLGGDLGSFGKNEMVPPFEEAAFALAEGEISPVVETTFGLHIIKVDERIIPSFDAQRDQFRSQVQGRMVMEAESTYVANLMEGANLQIDPEAVETIKQLAGDPSMELSSRALGRALVQYEGGTYTLGEFRTWLLTGAPNVPPQIQAAPDAQLENLLRSLTQSKLLVSEARDQGIEVPQARQDSLVQGVIGGVKGIAQQLGFMALQPEPGERIEATADRAVREILREIVQEGREVYPLQTVAFALREQYGARIFPAGIDRTVELVNELRAPAPATPLGMPPAETPDTVRADTISPEANAPDTTVPQGGGEPG